MTMDPATLAEGFTLAILAFPVAALTAWLFKPRPRTRATWIMYPRDGHVYLFHYRSADRVELLRAFGRCASNPDVGFSWYDVGFSWYDAARLADAVRKAGP